MNQSNRTESDILLQEIIFQPVVENNSVRKMYCRSKTPIMSMDECNFFPKKTCYDFSTYFNSLSIEKWKKYTYANHFALELKAKGSFCVELVGNYIDSMDNVQKEWLGRYYYDLKETQTIYLQFPEEANSSVVAFRIKTFKDTFVYYGKYIAKLDLHYLREPFISLVTTTFKKEQYVQRNIKLLQKNIFDDDEYSGYFQWLIIDNGRTLDVDALSTDKIKIIPNANVGGAGGFTRGMLESFKSEKKVTHILLMDDDVEFVPFSFKRLVKILSMLRPEYDDYFISGAMLENSAKNIQHEDVGIFSIDASHGPCKQKFDLNLPESVIRNERLIPEDKHQYAGWWYCCIPTTIANENNLPLPFFIRGDDVEYSIRNSAKFITMNGICIWHEGFAGKFSSSLELYQVHRNDLILTAIHRKLDDIRLIERIKELFWEEMYKFNYAGADLLLDAIEDFLKGPEFIENLNGEKNMKDKSAKDNKLVPLTPEVSRYIDYDNFYKQEELAGLRRILYYHTCNGQKRIRISFKSKVAVIPYGWGYYPYKQCFAGTIYAVDRISGKFVIYRRSIKEFKRLSNRLNDLLKRYENEYETLSKKYQERRGMLESKDFWISYLNRNAST